MEQKKGNTNIFNVIANLSLIIMLWCMLNQLMRVSGLELDSSVNYNLFSYQFRNLTIALIFFIVYVGSKWGSAMDD